MRTIAVERAFARASSSNSNPEIVVACEIARDTARSLARVFSPNFTHEFIQKKRQDRP